MSYNSKNIDNEQNANFGGDKYQKQTRKLRSKLFTSFQHTSVGVNNTRYSIQFLYNLYCYSHTEQPIYVLQLLLKMYVKASKLK